MQNFLGIISYSIKNQKKTKKPNKIFKLSSSAFALLGGILLASNTENSRYGFIFLACSSGQLLISSILSCDRDMTIYAGTLFVFVDLMGVIRWIMT